MTTATLPFIETKPKKYNKIKIEKESTEMSIIKVNTKKSTAKATYKEAKALHKADIKLERQAIAQAHRNIKSHRLLMKQARNIFKLAKLEEKK